MRLTAAINAYRGIKDRAGPCQFCCPRYCCPQRYICLLCLLQESGRAGRDGLPCESVTYVSADDLDTITRLEKANRAGAASEVTSFACQPGCKRKKILSYFGQKR